MSTPLPNSVAMRLSYKKYTDPLIYPGEQPSPIDDPGQAGAQQLRRVASTLSPVVATFKSNEIRVDQQMVDFRHGARKITGDIAGELSPKTYQDMFSSVVRGNWANGVSKSQTDFTSIAADEASSTLTVGSSTWAAQDFKVGDIVRLAGITGENLGVNFTITELDGDEATVYPAPADLSPDTAFTVAVVGRKVMPPVVSPVKTKFAYEHYYADANISHLFTECRNSTIKVGVPASGEATIAVSVLGRNIIPYETGASPFFTSPTAPTDTAILASFGGALLVDGVPIAVLTAADLTIDIKASTVDAAFNTLTPEIFTGVLDVNGTITALFENNGLLNSYLDEAEVAMVMTLTTKDDADADFISFFMPRVKFASANFANSGEEGIPVTMGFQAMKKATTTGFDAATIVIQDSLSAA